jgi:hypothetical protein
MSTTMTSTRWILPAACGLLLAPPALAAAPGTGGQAAPGDGVSSPAAPAKPQATPHRSAPRKRHARALVPLLTGVRCLGSCGADGRSVRVGGRLRLRLRNYSAGMQVLFPSQQASSASRHATVSARLRRTRSGFIVTVPVGASSGRLILVAVSGLRSRPFGPVRVLASASPPHANPSRPDIQPTGTAFDDPGMWVWYLSKSEGGNLDAILARAQATGVKTLYIKSSDGSSNYWAQFSPDLVNTLHQRGLRVCAWQYVYGTQPAGEAQLGARAVQAGADCLVIDAEAEYEGNYSAAQTYIQALRSAVGPSYPIALASFPYVDFHESLPYSVFLGPGGAQFNLPQMYWHAIGTTVDRVFAHTYTQNRVYARPIFPLGQTYGGTPPDQIFRFRQLTQAYGASGLSWWDWQETAAPGWDALAQPFTGAIDAVVAPDLAALASGAKGDQVVWMQEHLAAAQPQTPTSGVFDAATDSALRAFQGAKGLPVSGRTDPATWQALLALTPVAVDWTAPKKV